VRIYGITDRAEWKNRVATVAIRKEGTTPEQLAQAFAAHNVFVTNGNYYAVAISERLGVEQSGGMLRIGLTHYNTIEEVDFCLRVLARIRG
jgi:selenocysteine lyase/cysteine desulfurase